MLIDTKQMKRNHEYLLKNVRIFKDKKSKFIMQNSVLNKLKKIILKNNQLIFC